MPNTNNILACDVRDYYTGGGKDMAREFDFNVFWPPSPKVEGYRTWGAEKHPVCEDPQFVFTNKPWDRTWRDYDLKPSSPALKLGFKPIPMEKIGLRTNEFPFDLGVIERRGATRKIQAEDNDRVYHARNYGGSYVHHIEAGGWTKYENIDFGTQAPARIVAGMDYFQGQPEKLGQITSVPGLPLEPASPANAAAAGVAMELRLDSVEGKVIGTFHHGQTAAKAQIPVTGIHNIYLAFPRESVQSVNWFRFE